MVNEIKTSYLCGFNKGRSSKFRVDSWVRQKTSEEGRRTYQPKRCEYNNEDENNSPKTLDDKRYNSYEGGPKFGIIEKTFLIF